MSAVDRAELEQRMHEWSTADGWDATRQAFAAVLALIESPRAALHPEQIADLAARCGVKGSPAALAEFAALVREAEPMAPEDMRPAPVVAEEEVTQQAAKAETGSVQAKLEEIAASYDGVYESQGAEIGPDLRELFKGIAPTTSTVSAPDAPLPNEPKPCRQCDDSVGYVCEEHADGEEDPYNHACELMEKCQAERAKRGVEIGTQGSLCDGIAWLYNRLEELESAGAQNAEAIRNQALEEAAKLCESQDQRYETGRRCAAAIRALRTTSTDKGASHE